MKILLIILIIIILYFILVQPNNKCNEQFLPSSADCNKNPKPHQCP